MISINKFLLLCLSATQLCFLLGSVDAFITPSAQQSNNIRSIAVGPVQSESATELDAISRRREVFSNVKRAVFAGGIASIFRKTPAFADDTASTPTNGRIVEFEIGNVGGEEGKTGKVKIQLRPEWAPQGVKRFEVGYRLSLYFSPFHVDTASKMQNATLHLHFFKSQELSEQNFWNGCRFFRVLPGFIAPSGTNGNPAVQSKWRSANIPDDKVAVSNKRGTVVFATAGPNTRTSQIFINTRPQGNDFLDKQGFAPIGEVLEGMDIVDQLYSGYGEGAPSGKGPNQGLIQSKGNAYLESSYPKLSYISKASIN